MKRIVLFCAGGFSSGFYVKAAKKEIANRNLKWVFDEAPGVNYQEHLNNVDVVCVAPQIKYLFEEIEKAAKDKGLKAYQLSGVEYVPTNISDFIDNLEKFIK